MGNALERTGNKDSATSLLYRGQPISLEMLEDVWRDAGGADGGSLRTNRLSQEHFTENSHNRMRMYLKVQVISAAAARLIRQQARNQMRWTEYSNGLDLGKEEREITLTYSLFQPFRRRSSHSRN
jgi:hypothetical protein